MRSPSSLLADARATAGLSRRALALRAGVPTSTISRIEDGSVDPTWTMLERVLAAAGQRLEITTADLAHDPTLAGLSDAYDPTGRGTKVDWTRIRGLIDWLGLHPDRIAEAIATPPARTGSFVDALLAAIAEQLAVDAGIDPPRWSLTVPILEQRWMPPGTARMAAEAAKRTLEPFERRNIVLAADELWRVA